MAKKDAFEDTGGQGTVPTEEVPIRSEQKCGDVNLQQQNALLQQENASLKTNNDVLVRRNNDLMQQLGKQEQQIDTLEKHICKGVRFSRNDVTVFFDTQKKLYRFTFVKVYKIISREHRWFSGQFYCNKFHTDTVESTKFYEKNKERISWDSLNFKASIAVKGSRKSNITIPMPVVVKCVAGDGNYKRFNVQYHSSCGKYYKCQIGDEVTLEYTYEVPMDCWGSYINRTISYFKEKWKVTFGCDDNSRLVVDHFTITQEPNTGEDSAKLRLKEKNGYLFVGIERSPRICMGQYVIHWDADAIFNAEGLNSDRGVDESLITKF